jgi:hypothetical protein
MQRIEGGLAVLWLVLCALIVLCSHPLSGQQNVDSGKSKKEVLQLLLKRFDLLEPRVKQLEGERAKSSVDAIRRNGIKGLIADMITK